MNKAGKIISINPPFAIPGGEVEVLCEGFQINGRDKYECLFDGKPAQIVGASFSRILAIVPDSFNATDVEVVLANGGDRSDSYILTIGEKIAEGLHMVANPAVDPKDDSIIVTRSGSRGQTLPVTLLRLEKDGYLSEMTANPMNPTGIAFDKNGQLFVTGRADGEVYKIINDSEVVTFASDLGIATGLAFDKNGEMYVGDRSGTIYKVKDFGNHEPFAVVEPSVSAYHICFANDGKLYVTAPGLASFDAVYRVDGEGIEDVFYRGFGRPQGAAFDSDGNLYVAACLGGRRGIIKIESDGESANLFVSGMNIVGLCFTRNGELIVATNDSIYRLPVGIKGILLN